MECKIVREYLDGLTLEIDKTLFLDHMKTCSECQAHKINHSILEEDLSLLFNKGVNSSHLDKRIIRKTQSKRRKYTLIAAASLLVLLVSFSSEIITFAEKVPFIQDIIEMLNHDNQVEYALEKGYPVQEYTSENGEYTLMVKDIYVDSIEFRMQFTLVDKEGDIPIGSALKFVMPGITGDSYQFDMNPDDPWQSFSIDVSKKIRQMESFSVGFEVINSGEVTGFESVDVDISHMKTYTFDYVAIRQVVELPVGIAEIISLDFGPTAATVKYKMIEQYDVVDTRLDINLIDKKGNRHWASGSSWSSDSPVYTVKYEYSNLESALEDISLEIVGYSYNTVTSIGVIKDEILSFNYNGYDFTLKQYLDQGRDKRGRLSTPDIINATLFPELCIKEGNNWVAVMMDQEEVEYLPVSPQTILEALGEGYDTSDPTTIGRFVDYMKKEKDIEFDEEDLLTWPKVLDAKEKVYLKTTKKFLVDNEAVQWQTSLKGEGLEFGIMGDYIFEEIEIEVEMKTVND